jgi:uncharacterized YccA/Bax inhibitor family protein
LFASGDVPARDRVQSDAIVSLFSLFLEAVKGMISKPQMKNFQTIGNNARSLVFRACLQSFWYFVTLQVCHSSALKTHPRFQLPGLSQVQFILFEAQFLVIYSYLLSMVGYDK